LRQFVPDAFEWDDGAGRWRTPSSPEANDPVVATACDEGVSSFLIAPDTSEVFARCIFGSQYVDADGEALASDFTSILAIGDGGYLFASSSDSRYDATLIDRGGVEIAVTGLDFDFDYPRAVRASGAGFWVVVEEIDGELTLFHVDHGGSAILEGVYAPIPEGYSASYELRLAANGDVYQVVNDLSTSDDAIAMRPLDSNASTIVYTEADAPDWAQDYESTPPRTFILLHGSSLFTGP
jgi:hypothetical protein